MSQLQANRVARLLSGKPLKFTVRILRKDGAELEFQANDVPGMDWDTEARALMLKVQAGAKYDTKYPVIKWDDVATIVCEENPGHDTPQAPQ